VATASASSAASSLSHFFAMFPGWWAVPPVLGSALVIAAGPRTAVNRVLASPPAVVIGLISYPLYLWHWPLLVLVRKELPAATGEFLILLAASLTLAAATYLLVERPVRAFRLRPLAITAVAMMLLVAMAGVETVQTTGLPGRYNPPFPSILLPTAWPPFGGTHAEAGQRLGRASITRGNVGSTCTAGNRIGETALAGWAWRIHHDAIAGLQPRSRWEGDQAVAFTLSRGIDHGVANARRRTTIAA